MHGQKSCMFYRFLQCTAFLDPDNFCTFVEDDPRMRHGLELRSYLSRYKIVYVYSPNVSK